MDVEECKEMIEDMVCDENGVCRFENSALKVLKTDVYNLCNVTPSKLFSRPSQISEEIFDRLRKSLRKHIEPVSADKQCKSAGIEFTAGKTLCWLCGCVINDGEKKACEHIFPVVHAIMFNGIITTKSIFRKRFSNSNSELLKKVTEKNYRWAHANCNGAKGGLVLFKYDELSQKFIVDKEKCKNLQIKIVEKRDDCYSQTTNDNAIFDNLVSVITELLEPVNKEFEFFKQNCPNGDAIYYYAFYCLSRIKKYASKEALVLLREEKQTMDNEESTKKKAELELELETEIKLQEKNIQNASSILIKYVDDVASLETSPSPQQQPLPPPPPPPPPPPLPPLPPTSPPPTPPVKRKRSPDNSNIENKKTKFAGKSKKKSKTKNEKQKTKNEKQKKTKTKNEKRKTKNEKRKTKTKNEKQKRKTKTKNEKRKTNKFYISI